MCEKYDVAIIGGGVIGSSVAHFLAERGHKVAIIEKQRIASEASKAAAGLLGVQAEWDAYDPLFELARESRAIFPQLAAVLREKTGIDIGYEEKGIYRIAQNEDEKERILHIMDWQQKTGEDSYFLTGTICGKKSHFYPNQLSERYIIRKMVTLLHQSSRKHSHILQQFPVLIYMSRQKYLIFVLKIIK